MLLNQPHLCGFILIADFDVPDATDENDSMFETLISGDANFAAPAVMELLRNLEEMGLAVVKPTDKPSLDS